MKVNGHMSRWPLIPIVTLLHDITFMIYFTQTGSGGLNLLDVTKIGLLFEKQTGHLAFYYFKTLAYNTPGSMNLIYIACCVMQEVNKEYLCNVAHDFVRLIFKQVSG